MVPGDTLELDSDNELDQEISAEEVVHALKSLEQGKASGIDG